MVHSAQHFASSFHFPFFPKCPWAASQYPPTNIMGLHHLATTKISNGLFNPSTTLLISTTFLPPSNHWHSPYILTTVAFLIALHDPWNWVWCIFPTCQNEPKPQHNIPEQGRPQLFYHFVSYFFLNFYSPGQDHCTRLQTSNMLQYS